MASVYIETTVPSYYFETRTEPRIVAWRDATREWWDTQRFNYELCTSRFALRELAAAPAPKAQAGLAMLEETTVLTEPPELAEVIDFYLQHRLMPMDAYGDAAHLAIASLHSMNFLLTWNCRHLANANKVQHIAVLNARLRLHVPTITTPLTLMPEDDG
jgi:hypothetical protein